MRDVAVPSTIFAIFVAAAATFILLEFIVFIKGHNFHLYVLSAGIIVIFLALVLAYGIPNAWLKSGLRLTTWSFCIAFLLYAAWMLVLAATIHHGGNVDKESPMFGLTRFAAAFVSFAFPRMFEMPIETSVIMSLLCPIVNELMTSFVTDYDCPCMYRFELRRRGFVITWTIAYAALFYQVYYSACARDHHSRTHFVDLKEQADKLKAAEEAKKKLADEMQLQKQMAASEKRAVKKQLAKVGRDLSVVQRLWVVTRSLISPPPPSPHPPPPPPHPPHPPTPSSTVTSNRSSKSSNLNRAISSSPSATARQSTSPLAAAPRRRLSRPSTLDRASL